MAAAKLTTTKNTTHLPLTLLTPSKVTKDLKSSLENTAAVEQVKTYCKDKKIQGLVILKGIDLSTYQDGDTLRIKDKMLQLSSKSIDSLVETLWVSDSKESSNVAAKPVDKAIYYTDLIYRCVVISELNSLILEYLLEESIITIDEGVAMWELAFNFYPAIKFF